MHNAVERSARHDVYEERRDFVKAVEYQGVTPHDDCHSIVAIRQTVRRHEEPFRLGEDPQAEGKQYIDEIAEIGQEVVHSTALVGVDTDGHKVHELDSIPDVEPFRKATYKVSACKYVHNAANEGYLFSEADGLGIVPLLAELLDSLPHALPVSLELLVGRGDASPPFFHHSVAGQLRLGFEGIS